jgi:methylenetetrahydrofolate dehydrogenase (NADP+) / methenyltetrahydrofolate cyclohydrolase
MLDKKISNYEDSNIIDGKYLSSKLLETLKEDVNKLKEIESDIHIASVSIGDHGPIERYVRNQKRTANSIGIKFSEINIPDNMPESDIRKSIHLLNVNPTITGIILQRPVPEHLSISLLQSYINADKDVEGMHPYNIGQIAFGKYKFGPCTALASVELLKSTGIKIKGAEITIVGHSNIVGKPIAFILMEEGATVTVCHHMTRDLNKHLLNADVILVATGQAKLIKGNMIKNGSILIDIGINVEKYKNLTRIVGDADFESCSKVAKWITPVPGGVGPMTVAMLMKNAINLVKN